MSAPSRPSRMGRARAAAGMAAFLVLTPGVVAVLVPWWLTGWQTHDLWMPARAAGALLIVGGAAALLLCFARFVVEGMGRPRPGPPPSVWSSAVCTGTCATPSTSPSPRRSSGKRCCWASPSSWPTRAFAVAVAAFVHGYEEPTLARRFGDPYRLYRAAVPAWLPRLHAWNGVNAPAADQSRWPTRTAPGGTPRPSPRESRCSPARCRTGPSAPTSFRQPSSGSCTSRSSPFTDGTPSVPFTGDVVAGRPHRTSLPPSPYMSTTKSRLGVLKSGPAISYGLKRAHRVARA
jgi:hypothetical protein